MEGKTISRLRWYELLETKKGILARIEFLSQPPKTLEELESEISEIDAELEKGVLVL